MKKALLIQTLLEAIIPLAGYFLWNWDTSFILLFYFLDWSLFLVISALKLRKRVQYMPTSGERKAALLYGSIATVIVIAGCCCVFYTLPQLQQPFSWSDRIWSFLTYEDMGIQQGIILIPILFLNGWMVYKQQFLTPALFRKLSVKEIAIPAIVQSTLISFAALVAFVVSSFVLFPPEVLLFSALIGTTTYKWFFVRA